MTPTFSGLIQQGGAIIAADNNVSAGTHYKLFQWMRDKLQADLTAARGFATAQDLAEGNRRLDSREVQKAYEDGDDLIRKISKWLNSLDEDDNIPAQRAFYGLGPDLPKLFRHDEIETLLEKFVAAQTATGLNPDAKLSTTRLAKVNAVLDVSEDKSEGAGVGERSSITGDKLKAREALAQSIARVRYFLWATLPEMFKDPLLHNYGFVPRQESETQDEEPPTQPNPTP